MPSPANTAPSQQPLPGWRSALRWGYRHLPIPNGSKRSIWRTVQMLRLTGKLGGGLLRRSDKVQLVGNDPAEQQAVAAALCFAEPQQPVEISILIPCYNQLAYTLTCLRSLAEHPPAVSFEVIVINDASPNDNYALLSGIGGITLINNPINLGYLESCNQAAKRARGRYLHLLNNDTHVPEGSIDALHRTFLHHPNAGLVGSKLVYPNGMLQEAGGIVWNDGSAWNFGKFQLGNEPQFNYLRSVDYCSAASVMIPRQLFESLGGFDPIYKPAYYEDTDLALRVRQTGRDVLYQPQSTVVHFEGISHGTDETQGLKKHQQINRSTFEQRWASVLANHRANGCEADQEKDRGFERRVLLIDKCTPSPDRDAGSVVLLNLMLVLRHLGYQPTFIPDDNYANLEPYTPLCQSLGIECLYAPHVTSVRQHLKQQGQRYDLVILFRPDLTNDHLASVRRYCPQAKVIYYPHDLHFIRLEREGTLNNDRSLLQYARKSRAMELSNSSQADSTLVVSTSEQAQLQELLPQARVDFLPLIFSDQASANLRPRFGSCEMVFVGSFNHSPNADAVHWFASEILPRILEKLPQARLHVVGANPPKEIVALAGPSLQIHGFVEDLDRFFSGMALSVVPLRFGAGMKGKVGSALRCGLPVVSTSIGCEGMALEPGEGAVIADSAAAFSEAVVNVLSSEPLWNSLSNRGLEACSRLWGKQTTISNLQSILESLQLPTQTKRQPEHLVLYPFGSDA